MVVLKTESGLLHHLDTLANTFEKQGLEYERLDAASLNSRFPQVKKERKSCSWFLSRARTPPFATAINANNTTIIV